MRNKVLQSLFFILLFNSSLLIASESRVELRADAFFHTNKLFRKIYGNPGFDFQIQGSTEIWKRCELWMNLAWFTDRGHSVGFHDPTRVNLLNYSLGFNYLFPISCHCKLYLGIGPCFGVIWLKNHTHCENVEKASKGAFGGIVKSGVYYTFNNCFYVDLFVDYLYQPVHFNKGHHPDLGGVKTGIGIGKRF